MASPMSSDEGEIIESDAEDLKATSLPKPERNGVDRQHRTRGSYPESRSPEYGHDARQPANSRRSRSPRGFKRSRDGREYSNRQHRPDKRQFRIHYEDSIGGDHHQSRDHHDDLDRPTSRGSSISYNGREPDGSRAGDRHLVRGRDGVFDKKYPRNRSRSPRRQHSEIYREVRYKREGEYERRGDSRAPKYDYSEDSFKRNPLSKRAIETASSRAPIQDAKTAEGRADKQSSARDVAQNLSFGTKSPILEDAVEEPQVLDEEAEIERRRRRREEILSKSASATPLLVHALHSADRSAVSSPYPAQPHTSQISSDFTPGSGMASPMSGEQNYPSPGDLEVVDEADLINTRTHIERDEEDGPSAADYDPTVDMKEDERRDEMRHTIIGLHGKTAPKEEPISISRGDSEPDRAKDIHADDNDFNMFDDDFDVEQYAAKREKPVVDETESDANTALTAGGGILEGDDKDGYYKIRISEILNGRYQVQSTLGKGMFSGVARAVDITSKKLVAIKIMRNNDALRKGGYTEIAILQKLNASDPENRKHVVKFERHFDHKGHLCMVFENLSLNLREVLRKFGNNVGINLGATRSYAYQIFVALAHMRKCSIIHADLKPDNILVNESRNVLKICDLGTAIDRSDAATAHNEITPYLVSRFYRAPELILGIPYDCSIDMWSTGCTLYELYTGKILFTGDSNNQMLKTIMEIRGRLTPKMYRRGQLSSIHFDEKGNFLSVERDKTLGKTAVRILPVIKPTRDIRTRLTTASIGMNDAESRELNHFIDLLEHCLTLNPDKRIKPSEALKHPFFSSTSRVTPAKR